MLYHREQPNAKAYNYNFKMKGHSKNFYIMLDFPPYSTKCFGDHFREEEY